ncbi:MAG: DUF2125 domain-containing protein [Silicimonas sp.]|nr:DUF2125 domain-containing protein [Silicimonas sp.]
MIQRILAASLGCSLLASTALADLRAEDVLADQLNFLSGNGGIVARTTGTTPTSRGLTIDGYVLTFTADGADHEVEIDGVEMREVEDGSVRILYPRTLDIRMRSNGDNVEIDEAIFTLRLDEMSHIVSGDPDDIRHDIAFNRAALEDIRMTPSESLPETLDYEVAITDAATMIRLSERDPLRREASFDIGAMILRMALPDDDPGATFGEINRLDAAIALIGLNGRASYVGTAVPEHTLDLRFEDFSWRQTMSGEGLEAMDFLMAAEDLELAYDVAISLEALEDDPAAALRSGQRIEGRTSYGSMTFDVDAITPDGRFRSASAAGRSSGNLRFDRSGFTMSMQSLDNSADIILPPSAEIPFTELAYSIARSYFDIDIPFLPKDEPQPFRLAMAIEGVEMAEDIWSLFDPGKKIPRDALNLELDLDGTTVISEDPLAVDPGEMPFKEMRARLNAFSLNLAGAALTATGEVEDTSQNGAPSGIGRLDMTLTGFNTLLETLIAMGYLTDEQAMPARMGLGLIARPGDAPDTLVSTIEALEDGTILANGQRIK